MSLKSWGLELWDQVDKVFLYSNQGLEQVELFYRTLSDIHKIYLSLTKKHKALSIPNTTKVKSVVDNSSYNAGFNKFISCMSDQAGIYETQAEEIKNNVTNPMKLFIDTLKATISAQNNEYTKFKANLENQKRNLDRTWARYYQAYVNKKRAEANYNKIKDDKTVPRIDIDKVQSIANGKMAEFERMRGEYATQLQQFNTFRGNLYLQDLPKMCSELEMADRRRAEVTIETGLTLVSIQKHNLELTGKCNETVSESIRLIDYKTDSTNLVTVHKTNILFPPDIVFVDLDKSKSDSFNAADFPGILQQGGKIEKNDTAKSLFAGVGMKGIDSKDMLYEQVKMRSDEITNAMKRIEKSLSGLKTLGETYKNNPSMGDPSSLEPQMDVNDRQLASLREMSEVVNKQFQKCGGDTSSINKSAPSQVDRGGESDGSFDEDEEEDFDGHTVTDHKSNLAQVMYDFDSADAQQLSVTANMTVRVLTYDDSNSGWTLVQSTENSSMKGYVPTNYIRMS